MEREYYKNNIIKSRIKRLKSTTLKQNKIFNLHNQENLKIIQWKQ
jgi:hypothetical protein